MKLRDCKLGILVKNIFNGENGEIGHIVGLTYNVNVKYIGNKTPEELLAITIPLVQFPDGSKRGVHHSNLEIFNENI